MKKKLPDPTKQIVCTLYEKRVKTDYRQLKLALEMDHELLAIHSAIEFRQKKYLAPYVSKCSELKRNASTVLETQFMKGMSNIIYG